MYQDLSQFSMPAGFRGRSKWFVQCWWIVQALLFKPSPQFAYGFRAWLLRRFGANVGRNTVIRPSVTITYPWKVSIGDYAWIGDNAVLYSLGEIVVGDHAVVSQGCYLCAGDHDATLENFPIRARDIRVADEAWVASDVFVGPGVTIGRGAIVGARSSVFGDMPEGMVCFGHPCQPVRRRVPKQP